MEIFRIIYLLIYNKYLSMFVYLAMAAGVLCCLLRHKRFNMTVLQTLALCGLHAIFGNIGDRATARIVQGSWGGGCWYGVPLMILVSIFILTKLQKKSYETIGDMSAAGICCIHIVSKIACLFTECCDGFLMYYDKYSQPVHFPCREFEIAAYIGILIVLLVFEKKKRASGMLWELYMIWYSVIRYIAAWLRDDIEHVPFVLWIPASRLWTVVILIVGLTILYFHFKKKFGRRPSVKELIFAIVGKLPKSETAVIN
ncbi:MAG: prolipoprotein diacylglyceryl transferase [Ruminococcus sp.]|nr:prolipoprotein diacylglyceryl transferase [Ruminococcus sp.]